MNDISPVLRRQAAEAEKAALQAFRQWKARRRAQAGRWVLLALGILAGTVLGAGLAALVFAATRIQP